MTKKHIEADLLQYQLPEEFEVNPQEKPSSHWVWDEGHSKIEVVDGRRKSDQICVNRIRGEVDSWRDNGYAGSSQTTKDLFHWWFLETRQTVLFGSYSPYFVQREAIETLIYLLEVKGVKDVFSLLGEFGDIEGTQFEQIGFHLIHDKDQNPTIVFDDETAPFGLPQDGLRRFAVKAATGAGKTMIMAYIVAWCVFHSTREKGSTQAQNFLLLAPNVIVFERLKKDFENGKIFTDLSMTPTGWKFPLQVILRGDSTEPQGKHSLVLTNIQQLYDTQDKKKKKISNPIQAILGAAPKQNLTNARPMIDRVKGMKRLMVMNDEAHHVWDDKLKWNEILKSIHAEGDGLTAWLDFTATPKMMNGFFFPWVVTDYPLGQAVEQQIVKFPVIIKQDKEVDEPTIANAQDAVEKYEFWLRAGVKRLREHEKVYGPISTAKPLMFVMCEDTSHADAIGKWLFDKRSGCGFKEEEILVIHTNKEGEITAADLDKLRDQANSVDDPSNKVKVIVSVLILREGWDVKNVSIVLGLRPGTAKSGILPEQAVGRGLRLMQNIAGRQILEVMGTPSFRRIVQELKVDGVPIGAGSKHPDGVYILPVKEKENFNIEIPRTSSRLTRKLQKIEELDVASIPAIYGDSDFQVGKDLVKLQIEAMHTGGKLDEHLMDLTVFRIASDAITLIAQKTSEIANLVHDHSKMYPIVKNYIRTQCFGSEHDPDTDDMKIFLSSTAHRNRIAEVIAASIGKLITVEQNVEFHAASISMMKTSGFRWMRASLKCSKTVFNETPVWNNFESDFASNLDKWSDVTAFAALAETYTEFFVDYLKPNGAMGRYYPDFVVKQKVGKGFKYFVIETKGRVFEGTIEKDKAMESWCKQVSLQGDSWQYFRVNQDWYEPRASSGKFIIFQDLVDELNA
jgi:type III restriction enzyme